MKTSHLTTIVLVFFIFLSQSQAFVLPLDFLAKQTTSTTGRVITSIDQEVIFTVNNTTVKTNENWLVEGDKNLKVSVKGLGPIKDNLNLNFLYNSKTRTQVIGKSKNSIAQNSDFFTKLLFIRSAQSFHDYLKELGVLNQVRLSRAEGMVCVAIGKPSEGDKIYPQFWIDQDHFLIRKIRLPSGTEINLSDYIKVSDDFWLARTQTIKWNNNTVKIKVKSYNTKTGAKIDRFYPQNLDAPSDINLAAGSEVNQLVQEFYTRFR